MGSCAENWRREHRRVSQAMLAFPTLNNINQGRPALGSHGLGSLQAIHSIQGLETGSCVMSFTNEFIGVLLWLERCSL